MLRQAGLRLARRLNVVRPFTASAGSLAEDLVAEKGPEAFIEKFTPHVSSNLARPQFPSDFLPKKEEEAKEGMPEKLTLNFYLPDKQTLKDSKVQFLQCVDLLPPLCNQASKSPGYRSSPAV